MSLPLATLAQVTAIAGWREAPFEFLEFALATVARAADLVNVAAVEVMASQHLMPLLMSDNELVITAALMLLLKVRDSSKVAFSSHPYTGERRGCPLLTRLWQACSVLVRACACVRMCVCVCACGYECWRERRERAWNTPPPSFFGPLSNHGLSQLQLTSFRGTIQLRGPREVYAWSSG
jgi:hypothetical protein